MTLELYLFRHAESEFNLRYQELIGGRSDEVQLSVRGREQAKKLGRRLHEERTFFDEVYSSKAVRAIETARIALNQVYEREVNFRQVEDLLELSQGEWEGRMREEVYTPEVYEMMRQRPHTWKAPGGESQQEVEIRVYEWIRRNLLGRDITVGLFTHGLTIKCLLRAIMNSDPSLTYRMSIDNASITHLRHKNDGKHQGWSVRKINDHSHLVEYPGFIQNTYD